MGRDDLQPHFVCVRNKTHPSVDVATSSVLRLVKDLDDHIFLLLGPFSCFPHVDTDVVKALVAIVELGREALSPNIFPV